MPAYRIISELDPGPDHRESRGARLRLDEARRVSVLEATDLTDAVLAVQRVVPEVEEHADRRIISIEEVHPGFSYTDEQIDHALVSTENDWVRPEEFTDDEAIYGGGNFLWIVHAVAEALAESGLVPGLSISLLQNSEGFVDYTMVEIRDDARGIYLSQGSEIKRLTADRSATGWPGVLAIARELIALSNELH